MSEESRARILVWDLSSRLCHWGFALSSGASLYIGFRFDPQDELFKNHILLGFLAAWFLAVRIGLGFVGSRTARWRAFFHSPRPTLQYFAGVFRGKADVHHGLNPGTALFAMAFYIALIALIVTGYDADWAERWHGRFAWCVLGLIGCHLLGLTLHALRHRELTPLAMINGMRYGRYADGLPRECWAGGVALLVLSVLVTWLIFHYFDQGSSSLRIPFLPEIAVPMIQKG